MCRGACVHPPSIPNTNQPERKFLENRENREIRKIRNNKQKCQKTEIPKDPAKRKESQGKKFENKTAQAKAYPDQKPQAEPMRRGAGDLGENEEYDEGKTRKETGEITPGCVDRVECVVRSCDTMRVTICKAWAAI